MYLAKRKYTKQDIARFEISMKAVNKFLEKSNLTEQDMLTALRYGHKAETWGAMCDLARDLCVTYEQQFNTDPEELESKYE